MSTSQVSYGNRFFWADDVCLGLWFHFMAEAADRLDESIPWLMEVKCKWRERAGIGGGAVLNQDLDEILVDDSHRSIFAELNRKVDARMDELGPRIPVHELEPVRMAGTRWPKDGVDSLCVRRVCLSIERLLRGDTGPEDGAYMIETFGAND